MQRNLQMRLGQASRIAKLQMQDGLRFPALSANTQFSTKRIFR